MSGDEIVDWVEVIKDPDGQFRVRARSDNNKIIWTTEKYTDHSYALKFANESGFPVKDETQTQSE